ncbi:MAG: tetratricopeptide repeat protein [Betaproteobacteria bacterium]|nr:tetratricopeptide repeat protein [Betaproteobacteria bacterium]
MQLSMMTMKPPPQTTPQVASFITKQFNSALVAFQTGDLDRAERALQMVLEQSRHHFDALYLLGIVKAQRKEYAAALRLLDEAVALRPDIQEAQQNRRIVLAQCCEARIREALVLHQQGRLDEADAIYQEVLQRDPDNFDAIQLRGTLAAQKGDYACALEYFQRVLAIKPDFAEVHCNRGNALKELKRFDEALASYDRAIAIKSGYADAHNNRGLALHELKRFDEALASYDRAIAIRPGYADACNNRGNALLEMKRPEDALASYDRAIAITPEYADAYNNRGNALKDMKRLDDALASYDRAIAIKPDFAEAYDNRGAALLELGRPEDALASHGLAIAIKPDYADAYNNQGIVLQKLKRLDDALASYEQAIAIRPDDAGAFNNRGNALKELKRFDEALASYERAFAIKPDFAEAHWNQGLCRLLIGDFAKGWEQYEWRWQREKRKENPRHGNRPLWLGSPDLSGKTILLWSEQGLGDTLQFCRYARLVADLGATVYLEVQQSLKALLKDLDGVASVFGEGDALPEFDCQCPLLSLPLAFRTTQATISGAPYIRVPAPRPWMAASLRGARPRIGVAWSGNMGHSNDQNRSLPFLRFQSLLPPGLEVVCLQKDIRDADRVALAMHPEIQAVDSHLNDFTDTAALMHELDLVVAVDTSIAHLAGATGKEVWLLLPWIPDWRWLLDRTDSPWYDSVTLFRQPAIGDWDSVLAEVRQKLIGRFGAR